MEGGLRFPVSGVFEHLEDILNVIKKIIKFEKHQAIKNKVGKFCFSQWFELPFTVDGINYQTAEHWMMANKALLFNDVILIKK